MFCILMKKRDDLARQLDVNPNKICDILEVLNDLVKYIS